MKYLAVFIDLDGTLLNEAHIVSDFTKDTLKLAKKAGIHIVINSGRVIVEAEDILKKIEVPLPFISANGAYLRTFTDTNQEEDTILDTLSFDTLCEVRRICSINGAYLHLFTSHRVYMDEGTQRLISDIHHRSFCMLVSRNNWNRILVDQSNQILKGAAMCVDERQAQKVHEQLRKLGNLEVIYTGKNYIEFNNKGITKGSGMISYLKKYGIPKEATIAIGDHENDIPMIENAGFGVAMENAIDSVKQKADYITFSNHLDGVAKVLLKYVI